MRGHVNTDVKAGLELETFCSRERCLNRSATAPQDLFGKHVASGLRAVTDLRHREYAKVKIQEILFNAQFGLLGIPFPQQQNSFQQSFMEQLNSFNVASPPTLNSNRTSKVVRTSKKKHCTDLCIL